MININSLCESDKQTLIEMADPENVADLIRQALEKDDYEFIFTAVHSFIVAKSLIKEREKTHGS